MEIKILENYKNDETNKFAEIIASSIDSFIEKEEFLSLKPKLLHQIFRSVQGMSVDKIVYVVKQINRVQDDIDIVEMVRNFGLPEEDQAQCIQKLKLYESESKNNDNDVKSLEKRVESLEHNYKKVLRILKKLKSKTDVNAASDGSVKSDSAYSEISDYDQNYSETHSSNTTRRSINTPIQFTNVPIISTNISSMESKFERSYISQMMNIVEERLVEHKIMLRDRVKRVQTQMSNVFNENNKSLKEIINQNKKDAQYQIDDNYRVMNNRYEQFQKNLDDLFEQVKEIKQTLKASRKSLDKDIDYKSRRSEKNNRNNNMLNGSDNMFCGMTFAQMIEAVRAQVRAEIQLNYQPQPVFIHSPFPTPPLGVKSQIATFAFPRSLIDAVKKNNIDMVKSIIRENPSAVNEQDSSGKMAIHFVQDTDILEVLLRNRVNVHSKDQDHKTALHHATDTRVANLLISNGLGVNERSKDGWTPLHYAALKQNFELCELLIRCGARTNDRNDQGRTALHIASTKGDINIVALLIDHGSYVNEQDTEGDTPLHCAVTNSRKTICAYLIQRGANVNEMGKHGRTALHWAVLQNNKELCDMLIASGAYVNSRDIEGNTPLGLLVKSDVSDEDMIEYLESKGCEE